MPDEPKKPENQIEITEEPAASLDELLRDRTELQALRCRQADEVAQRFSKLPPGVRERLPRGASLAEAQAFLAGVESAIPARAASPSFLPPGMPDASKPRIFETDLERMPFGERQKLIASGELERAVAEGRFVPKGQEALFRGGAIL